MDGDVIMRKGANVKAQMVPAGRAVQRSPTLSPVTHVRKFFPETWLWSDAIVEWVCIAWDDGDCMYSSYQLFHEFVCILIHPFLAWFCFKSNF